jgi:hypothetical protein
MHLTFPVGGQLFVFSGSDGGDAAVCNGALTRALRAATRDHPGANTGPTRLRVTARRAGALGGGRERWGGISARLPARMAWVGCKGSLLTPGGSLLAPGLGSMGCVFTPGWGSRVLSPPGGVHRFFAFSRAGIKRFRGVFMARTHFPRPEGSRGSLDRHFPRNWFRAGFRPGRAGGKINYANMNTTPG